MTNYSLEEVVIQSIELRGLEPHAVLDLSVTTRSLNNSESNPVENKLQFSGSETKEVNLLLFSRDQCQIKMRLTKDISKVLEKFANRKLRCDVLRDEYEQLLEESRIKKQDRDQMSSEELDKKLALQVETVEKKYKLKNTISKCAQKITLKKFRQLKKAVLVFHLNGGKSFEVRLRNRNLLGEVKILPEEPELNVIFPGANKRFKFQVLNTFGKTLKILRVENKPLKLGLFDAYASKKLIPSSPTPSECDQSSSWRCMSTRAS